MASGGAGPRFDGIDIDEDAVEVRRARAEARRRLFGDARGVMRIGRFELVRPLGAGAMGTVYLARDPTLDRSVALKLLHRDRSSRARARLLREARSMAQIDDPRVATVLDVGTHQGRVYLAMEVIDGIDLASWLEDKPPWSDVLDAFIDAALGLAAAHEAGVIHRDFKPSNVMRDRAGRTVVVDFGLAAASAGFTEAVEGGAGQLTQAGAVLGTPAFMAPEQHEGVADARSDQYAFCVALHDAMDAAPPPAAARHRLRSIIARGCDPDPEQRFADMHALVDALRSIRRPLAARPLVAATIVVAGVAAALAWPDPAPPAPDCTPPRLSTSPEPFDPRVAEAVTTYASRWRETYRRLCEEAPARLACLDAKRRELEALLRRFPATKPNDAIKAVASLGSPAVCRTHGEAAPRAGGEAWRERMAKARALQRTGDFEAAQATAIEATRDALADDDPGRQSDAWLLRAAIAEQQSNDTAARHAASQAVWLAMDARDDRRLAEAAAELAFLEATDGMQIQEAYRWSRVARAAAQRLDMPRDLGILLDQVDGAIAYTRGDYEAARMSFEAALDQAQRAYGAGAYELAPMLTNLGGVAYALSDFGAARNAWSAAARITKQTLGDDHPDVATDLSNLAIALMALHDYELAADMHRRALEIRQRALAPGSPSVADSHHNLGIVLDLQGLRMQAREHHEAALQIRKRSYGPRHPALASSHAALGNLALREERWDDAHEHHRRAVDLWIESLGADHPDVVRSRARMAEADLQRGRARAALDAIEEVLEAWLPRLGPSHQDVVAARTMHGVCLLELGRVDDARAVLERALQEVRVADVDPSARAELELALVRVLWRDPSQRERATRMVHALRAALDAAPQGARPVREQVDAWLADPPSTEDH